MPAEPNETGRTDWPGFHQALVNAIAWTEQARLVVPSPDGSDAQERRDRIRSARRWLEIAEEALPP